MPNCVITGGWLGSKDHKLPRARVLYDRKVKWSLREPELGAEGDWRSNYGSVDQHVDKVERQFRDEIKEDMMLERRRSDRPSRMAFAQTSRR